MEFDNLHQILRSLYEQMMPLCADMAGVAKGIAGLGALFYVAYRVWQSLARAEPIDVFPMLRPFAIGLCIMFFPTVVLGTINSVLSPVVQGTAKLLETQTLDMNKYREQKDRLEYEAMVRNPETAYLVSNEEFDKQLEELGWSPSDMVTMAGMYIDRGMYKMKKGIRDFFREILELMFQAAALVIDTRGAGDTRSDSLRHIGVGRLPKHAHAVDMPLHTGLSVAARVGHIQHHTRQDSGVDAPERHRAHADRPQLLAGFQRRGVYRVHDNRHHRLLHHSDGGGLDHPSRGHGRLRAQREPDGGTRRRHGGKRGGCYRRQHGRTCRETAEIINVEL